MADEIDPCSDRAEIALERWDVRSRAAVRRILSAEVLRNIDVTPAAIIVTLSNGCWTTFGAPAGSLPT